jgi:hypothetical protein
MTRNDEQHRRIDAGEPALQQGVKTRPIRPPMSRAGTREAPRAAAAMAKSTTAEERVLTP